MKIKCVSKFIDKLFFRCSILVSLLFALSGVAHAHPFLWKVSGAHEFYLFGTIHLPDPRVTIISKDVDQALAVSDNFYAELDLSESNTMLIRQSMWMPDKQTVYDYLSPELEEQIDQYLHDVNPDLNLEFFAEQKIWVLAITLTVLEQQLKYPGHPPLDTVLYNRAVALGLNTGGLETVEEQLEIFESLSIDEQLVFLQDTVEFMHSSLTNKTSFIEASITNYLAGDLEGLMIHLMSYMKDNEFYTELLARLIDQRNVRMTSKMLDLVRQTPNETYFFALGAGHFWGPSGINAILEEQGYSVVKVH